MVMLWRCYGDVMVMLLRCYDVHPFFFTTELELSCSHEKPLCVSMRTCFVWCWVANHSLAVSYRKKKQPEALTSQRNRQGATRASGPGSLNMDLSHGRGASDSSHR